MSRKAWLVRVVISLVAFAPKAVAEQRTRDVAKRPVTVADAATMTRIGEPLYVGYTGVGPKQDFAAFSPDGSRFVFVISKGNLEKNVNEYWLLVFRTANTFNHPVPMRLITFSSASNNQGISNLRWLADNDTLLFLGSRGVGPTQLYSIRCSSRKLKRLTNHGASLKSYATSADGRTLVYAAEAPRQGVATPSVKWNGLDVTTEDLSDLIAGKTSSLGLDLLATRNSEMKESRLHTLNSLDTGIDDLFLSPDGRYLILKTDVRTLPKRWEEYHDQTIQTAFRRQVPQGSSSGLLGYELIDIATNKAMVLLDAPAPFSSFDVMWSPDSRSVILCGVYLPLDVSDPTELNRRRSTKYAIEIELPSRKIVSIAAGELRSVSWNAQTHVVQFHPPAVGESDGAADVYYQKIGREWKQIQRSSILPINPLPDRDLPTPSFNRSLWARRIGLLFLDAHADFYQPEAEPHGEVASMELALATGRGPDALSNLEGLRPPVRETDVVAFARRDEEDARNAGSQRIEDSGVKLMDLEHVAPG